MRDLFTWDGLGNVFILVAIVMNTGNCAIAVITHSKWVVLSDSSNTTAMWKSDVIKEGWEHKSTECLTHVYWIMMKYFKEEVWLS